MDFADKITFAGSPMEAAKDAEVLIIATEWEEFAQVDLDKLKATMQTPLIYDGRNLLDPETVKGHGFEYRGIGRGCEETAVSATAQAVAS